MISIRKFKSQVAYDAALLIRQTYSSFNKREGTQKAVGSYIKHYDPNKNLADIKKRFARTSMFFVAIDNGKIIGMIRGIENQIVNLFVKGDYHRKGIGSKLLAKYESVCRRKRIKKIKLRASLYAIPFYEASGYRKTTGIRNFKGLNTAHEKIAFKQRLTTRCSERRLRAVAELFVRRKKMTKMQLFKDFKKLTSPDGESIKINDGTLNERYKIMSSLTLPNTIPEPIRTYCDFTRMLWLYGWFCYPFYGCAGLHAAIAVEMALRYALAKADISTSNKSGRQLGLGGLMRKAVQKKLLNDEDLRRFDALIELLELNDFRNQFELEMKEIADAIGETYHQSKRRDFVDELARFFPDIRNVKAHGSPTELNTPSITKYHIELARSIIMAAFNENTPNKLYL